MGQAGEHLLFPSSKFTEKIMLDYYGDFLDVLMEKKCFRYIELHSFSFDCLICGITIIICSAGKQTDLSSVQEDF